MRCLLCTLALVLLGGCRSQSTAMTNPFLAPNRVPPPATRTLLPGTAQPYYQGDPLPTSPAIGAPPVGVVPGTAYPSATPTYAPQPAGTVPPGGWNTTPQAIPQGSSSYNALPSTVQPASAIAPVMEQPSIQIQPDQQSLRFAGATPSFQANIVPTNVVQASASLPPEPSILPTQQLGASPYPNQVMNFQTQPQFVQQPAVPTGESREVRIRAISSDEAEQLSAGAPRARDGFRPQGSSRVRKPTIVSRLTPQKRQAALAANQRYGFDPNYQWLRGQLAYAEATGQWELRYASSAGNVDSLGGSLTIANPQVLGNLQPGDFVHLRGHVQQLASGSNPSLPVYQVSVVRRQRI